MSGGFDVREDFKAWLCEHTEPLRLTARRHARDHQAADDAVQIVLERFWKKWEDAEFREKVKNTPGYAQRCVINAWRSTERSETAERERLKKYGSGELVPETQDLYSDIEWKLSLPPMLEMLEPTWRSVIELRYQQGKSFPEIAAVMGISESTARRYDKGALDALSKAERAWGEKGGRDGPP
ncbi:sigma-70 family RNA polymerase sigma factor [Streptomyces sp. NPDC005322]|uniref:RNA polymerase sigma factor n=1 Tax=unclassified Streptomyces TaxID=2593676 RepID=UPI0033B824FC